VSLEAERYAGLISLSDELARATSATMVCAALTAHAAKVVGGSDAVIFVREVAVDGEQNRFVPVARGPGKAQVDAFDAPWPISRPGLVDRQTAQQPNSPYRSLWDALGPLNPGSVVHVPVGVRLLLVVVFSEGDRQLSRDEWTILASVAEQTAATNERLEALARVRELSLCDSETGLGNRRLVDLVLQHRFAGAVRGEPLSLVALRVAGASDDTRREAIRRVAELLHAQQRGSDVAAHIGKGLFVVVLHGAGAAGAEAFLRRVRGDVLGSEVVSAVVTHSPAFATPGDFLAAVLSLVGGPPEGDEPSDGPVDTRPLSRTV
jgi:GGDEF domain-containing protein